jgi:hypothetical protein
MTVRRLSGKTMKKFYFTFGFGQPHANRFHIIKAESHSEARKAMVSKFGTKWSMQYTEEKWYRDGISQEEEYGLKEIK